MLLLLTILLKSSESVGWKTPWKTTALYITSRSILEGIISTYTLTSAWYSKNNHRSTTATPHVLSLHCFTFAQRRVFSHIVACILMHEWFPLGAEWSAVIFGRVFSCVACNLLHEWFNLGAEFTDSLVACILMHEWFSLMSVFIRATSCTLRGRMI